MGREINFVTLYPACPNYGLVKDVGQIPYALNKINGVHTGLASSCIDMTGEHIQYLEGMSIYQIGNKNQFLDGVCFILKNAKKIDWLNLFHGGRKCYYWTKLFKFLNPHGKVYIKMDLSYEGCRHYRESEKEKRIFVKTTNAADIVSVESGKIQSIVKDVTGMHVELIPNGYMDIDEETIDNVNRENVFITVGRLGTPPKATDILLEAFAQSALEHDWSLKLVGPIEEEFKPYIEDFYKRYPELKNRVRFMGAINDRPKLYAEYRSARVFVLPSRWEGSPLVGPEALFNGCRMILTDVIPPIDEFTNKLQFGTVVETSSIEALKNALINEANRQYEEKEHLAIKEYAKENLLWDSIVARLYELMKMETDKEL